MLAMIDWLVSERCVSECCTDSCVMLELIAWLVSECCTDSCVMLELIDWLVSECCTDSCVMLDLIDWVVSERCADSCVMLELIDWVVSERQLCCWWFIGSVGSDCWDGVQSIWFASHPVFWKPLLVCSTVCWSLLSVHVLRIVCVSVCDISSCNEIQILM